MYDALMGTTTDRLGLYLPGGGSASIGGADESADIDQLNQNFQKINDAAGGANVTSSTKPSPAFHGQIILESDTGNVMIFDSTRGSGEWVPIDRTWRQKGQPSGTRRTGDGWVSW